MKHIAVNKNLIGQRIDKFLTKELSLYTRGEIIRNIKSGNILINKKKVKPSYVLKEKDTVVVNISKGENELVSNSSIEFKTIYKDSDIIVVDKPAGLKTHPINYDDNDSLVNGLIARFPEIKSVNDNSSGSELRPGIVHRLDKDTSGVIVIARKQESFNELKKIFKEREVTKKYLAMVYGKLKSKKGIIKKPIARAENYKKQVIAGRKTKTKIREAVTEYKVLKEHKDYSLVELFPRTGRMHQIRIHLFSLGHPVIGDDKYKLKKTIKPKNVSRQLLHAKELEFKLGSKKHSFQAKLPSDFSNFLTLLETSTKRISK